MKEESVGGPRVPEDFAQAYEGLVALVERVEAGEVREAGNTEGGAPLREEVDAYRREDCRGSQTLAEGAALVLRYELSSTGLAEDPESVTSRMGALGMVEEVLKPDPGSRSGSPEAEEPPIVEVALPEELRRRMPAGRGFRMGGLQILFEPTEGPPHAHLSISHPDRYPSWEELLRARTALEGPPPNLFAWVPKPEELRITNPKTVHLYVLPPEELLG